MDIKIKNIKDTLLLASVFVTGSAVLIVEIVAIRILSPYYGNTIYTTSSVIGTVLAALSLGYYLGGIIADKYPNYRFFYSIIFISGLLIIFMQFLNIAILPILGILFSITTGPLVSSIFIFFVPAFSLGVLSPFAVKLHKKEGPAPNASHSDAGGDKIGRRSGEVFFWSTVGSIAGSLLSGFVFIPHFGINSITMGTGVFLSLWGLCGFLLCPSADLKEKVFFKNINKKILMLTIFLFLFVGFVAWSYPGFKSNVVYEKDGLYEKIKILDGEWKGSPVRFLFQDRSYSAAMYLNYDDLVYDYTKYYKLYKLSDAKATNALVIGGGAYSMPKALLKDSPDMQVDVAEIEPELYTIAKKYFNLPDDAHLTNYIEDGRHFLKKNQKKYDIIISDVYYSLLSMPIHFTTKEFFDLAKYRLSDGGFFIGNFIGSGYFIEQKPDASQSFILSEMKTFKNIFPNSYFFAVDSLEHKTSQNIIFLGINGEKRLDFNSNIFLESNDPIISGLGQKNIDLNKFDLSKYEELTDNFSPVEYLMSKVINRWY